MDTCIGYVRERRKNSKRGDTRPRQRICKPNIEAILINTHKMRHRFGILSYSCPRRNKGRQRHYNPQINYLSR
jgi:hypothetical protein